MSHGWRAKIGCILFLCILVSSIVTSVAMGTVVDPIDVGPVIPSSLTVPVQTTSVTGYSTVYEFSVTPSTVTVKGASTLSTVVVTPSTTTITGTSTISSVGTTTVSPSQSSIQPLTETIAPVVGTINVIGTTQFTTPTTSTTTPIVGTTTVTPPSENQPPVASFTYSPENPKSGEEVIFDGSNSYDPDPDGTIVSYKWDFGDGETAEGYVVEHRFRGAQNEPKTYSVTLTVEDNDGATDTDTGYVTVYPLEETLEVSHQPTIPIPGQPVFAKMTVSYNWIHENTYVVSKIHYESEGFLGIGVTSIWDFHSYEVPMPIWAAHIFSFGAENERTYYPKLSQIQYGGDTYEGIAVDAFDAMNVNIMGWAGISISVGRPPLPNFFETSSACFEPDYTEVPDVPIEEPDLYLAHLCSPGELRVYDSQGQVTGLVNGEQKEGIPNSAYFDNTVIIFSLSDTYYYEVEGTGDGLYGLVVASIIEGEGDIFTATDIPISTDAIHQYAIDWDALHRGEEGVTIQIDSDGDGIFEQTITADSELTHDEFILQTATIIDFNPNILNLKSEGEWVTVYIELPMGHGYDVNEIDLGSIMLNGQIPSESEPTEIGDYDGDGIPDLMVKFERSAVHSILEVGDKVEIIITGELIDERPFEGSDTIRTLT